MASENKHQCPFPLFSVWFTSLAFSKIQRKGKEYIELLTSRVDSLNKIREMCSLLQLKFEKEFLPIKNQQLQVAVGLIIVGIVGMNCSTDLDSNHNHVFLIINIHLPQISLPPRHLEFLKSTSLRGAVRQWSNPLWPLPFPGPPYGIGRRCFLLKCIGHPGSQSC